jgi:ribonuclease HII
VLPPENLNLFPENAFRVPDRSTFYEEAARGAGFSVIAGVDEVGRGPLAGPVVAAAVILPEGVLLPEVKDSKQMTPRSREKAFKIICREALSAKIGVVSWGYIDRFNILKASLEAMARAVQSLDPQPGFLLIDGIHPVSLPIPQQCLKKGDQISLSISAASIVAKVYRDSIMTAYHDAYPVYGFAQNKGYGTSKHLEALKKNGPSPIHRLTFNRVL